MFDVAIDVYSNSPQCFIEICADVRETRHITHTHSLSVTVCPRWRVVGGGHAQVLQSGARTFISTPNQGLEQKERGGDCLEHMVVETLA
jgi:hypothetical protein